MTDPHGADGTGPRGAGRSGRRRRVLVAVLSGLIVVAVGLTGVAWQWVSTLRSVDQQLRDLDGLDDFDGSFELDVPDPANPTVPLAADELYAADSFSFRINTGDRVMEGELHLVDALDHAECRTAAQDDEVAQALAQCESRIEGVYTGAADGLWVSQQVLVFSAESHAETFAQEIEGQYAGEFLSFQDDNHKSGSDYQASRSGQIGVYVVVTRMISDSAEEEAVARAEEHARARHAESMSYVSWR